MRDELLIERGVPAEGHLECRAVGPLIPAESPVVFGLRIVLRKNAALIEPGTNFVQDPLAGYLKGKGRDSQEDQYTRDCHADAGQD